MRSRDLLRLYTFLLLLSAAVVIVAVLRHNGGTPSSGELVAPDIAVDRIAYVGLDSLVRTVNPDGSDEVRVGPDEGYFTWPTWSPDGRNLAFSGVIDVGAGEPQAVLYASETLTETLRELHFGEPGLTGLVAQGAPHYPFGSPDSSRLAFVGVSRQGLTLYVDDLGTDAGPKFMLYGGGPLWIDWSPDSSSLLVHRGRDLFLVDVENAVAAVLPVVSDGGGYFVPAWKPFGDTITFVSGNQSDGYGLYTSGRDAVDGNLLDEVPENAAFLWSPGGQFLAVTGSSPEIVFHGTHILRVYERVDLYTAEGSRHPVEIQESVVAFFWSPDSTKLAYVTLGASPGAMRWKILDVVDGTSWPLVDFLPSADQWTVFSYFDQYAHSHSLWSPDSGSMVFAGRIATGALSASLTQHPADHILVLATYANATPQVIADGYLAFWSPR